MSNWWILIGTQARVLTCGEKDEKLFQGHNEKAQHPFQRAQFIFFVWWGRFLKFSGVCNVYMDLDPIFESCPK